jgi:ribosomal protein S12 methylthiotransferase
MKGQVSEPLKKKRVATLMQTQQKISRENNQKKMGKEIEVLVEETPRQKGESCAGRSEWDAPEIDGMVYLTDGNFQPGSFVRAKVIDFSHYDLIAQPLD